MTSEQAQNVGDGSAAIQTTGAVTINQGLSVADATEIAIRLFKENFPQLRQEALALASARAEEIAIKAIEKVAAFGGEALNRAADPDFQLCLLEVERGYARSGDEELGELLTDMVADRAKESDSRSETSLIVGESVRALTKITSEQIAALALCFLLTQIREDQGITLAELTAHISKIFLAYKSRLATSPISFRHLQYAGCGWLDRFGGSQLEAKLATIYPEIFRKGFDANELSNAPELEGLVIQHATPGRLTIDVASENDLRRRVEEMQLEPSLSQKLNSLFYQEKPTAEDVLSAILAIAPELEELFDIWRTSYIALFVPTSVGIMIGYASARNVVGVDMDIPTLLNET